MQQLLDQTCVVVVTFNSADVVARALGSIPEGPDVIVVDNASTDDSVEICSGSGARCLSNETNIGFGAACNKGAAASDRDYILFLNPDAVLRPGALETMLDALRRDENAGAAGPKFVDSAGHTIWRYKSVLQPVSKSMIRLPVAPDGECCMPLLTGAALLCRRDAFEDIGGFDENIFLYFEDDDLSERLIQAGRSLIYTPAAEVIHDFGLSSGVSEEMTRFKYRQRLCSQAYVMEKYGIPFHFNHMKQKSIQRLIFAVFKFDRYRRAAALGYLDALKNMPSKRHGVRGPSIG